jgi:hypothetical protein
MVVKLPLWSVIIHVSCLNFMVALLSPRKSRCILYILLLSQRELFLFVPNTSNTPNPQTEQVASTTHCASKTVTTSDISSTDAIAQLLQLEMPSHEDAHFVDELSAEDDNEMDIDIPWSSEGFPESNEEFIDDSISIACSDDDFPVDIDDEALVRFKLPFGVVDAYVPRTPLSNDEIRTILAHILDRRVSDIPCRFTVNNLPLVDRVTLQDGDYVHMVLMLLGGSGKKGGKKNKPPPKKTTAT